MHFWTKFDEAAPTSGLAAAWGVEDRGGEEGELEEGAGRGEQERGDECPRGG